jgi:hypothetical protein
LWDNAVDADLLGNLFVQVDRLHGSLRAVDVVRALEEALLNLVGSEDWVLFLRDDSSGALEAILSHGRGAELRADDGDLSRALATRDVVRSGGRVALPLLSGLGRDPVGGVVIDRLLAHRPAPGPREESLCRTLARHGGLALEAALCVEAIGVPRCDVVLLRDRLRGGG